MFDNLKVFAVKVVGFGDNSVSSPRQEVQPKEDGWVPDMHKIAKTQIDEIRDCRGSWNLS